MFSGGSFQWAFYEATHNKTPVKRGHKRVCGEVHGLIALSLECGWSTLKLRGQGPLMQRDKGLLLACFRWHYYAYDDFVDWRTNKVACGVSTHSWGHETSQFLCQWCNIYINSYIHIYSMLKDAYDRGNEAQLLWQPLTWATHFYKNYVLLILYIVLNLWTINRRSKHSFWRSV